MCGIAGFVNWGSADVLDRMTSVQVHRGPDDGGTWLGQCHSGQTVGLGSRRLAILDLSPAGHMPMQTNDGRFTIVYNGEIYNYPELRRQLEQQGVVFKSHCDTEAILCLYQRYGRDVLDELNGMFAFAIWDREREEMFLARDHFGIKPLYYCQRGSGLGFASEIKALLELPEFSREISLKALHQYLTFLWVPDPLTMFEGVYKLPAGHFAVFRQGSLEIQQYWDLRFPAANHIFTIKADELAAELRSRFVSTVKSQMLSDVPIGSFLSAGLDSSGIVAAMAQQSTSPVQTYTIAFPEKYRIGHVTLDDTDVAARTAAHFGCKHTEIRVDPDVVALLPKLVWHMDEPVADPAIITAYLVNHEARETATVLLSGVGGDELFAGYRKHQAHEMAQRYQKIPAALRRRVLEPLTLALPSLRGTRLGGYVRLAKKMARSGSLSRENRFLMDSTYLTEDQKASVYLASTRERLRDADVYGQHRRYFEAVEQADFLNQMLYVDTKAFMVSLNLTYNDKMSMASSVEVRVPFLDRHLAEWTAMHVPPDLKLRNGTTKHIFREAMRPFLPREVLDQKKAGFGAPIDYWLAGELREITDDLLSENRLRGRGLFEPTAVRQLIDQHRAGRQDWSMQIWQFLTLEIWMQTFIDCKVTSDNARI